MSHKYARRQTGAQSPPAANGVEAGRSSEARSPRQKTLILILQAEDKIPVPHRIYILTLSANGTTNSIVSTALTLFHFRHILPNDQSHECSPFKYVTNAHIFSKSFLKV